MTFVYLYTSLPSELPLINVEDSGSEFPEYEFWNTDTREEAERQRRETERGRGSVEFVHPDLKQATRQSILGSDVITKSDCFLSIL